MKRSIILVLAVIVVMTRAGLIHPSSHHEPNLVSEGSHEDFSEEDSDFEECVCGEDDLEWGNTIEDNSTRTKRQCGCGYGYCGCTAPTMKTKTKTKAETKSEGIFVVPFPIPAPAPAPLPSPVQPPQTQLPQQSGLPQTSVLSSGGNGESVCDRLRLILTLTNQLEGLKLVEIAGHCVVQSDI